MCRHRPEEVLDSVLIPQEPESMPKSNLAVLEAASHLPAAPRFLHLLSHTKMLIQSHGPYTTITGTTVFARAATSGERTEVTSVTDLATSLATAQDCIYSAQPWGSANEDLVYLKQVWEAAIAAPEEVLESDKMDLETVGWCIFGLTSGYVARPGKAPDARILSYKTRLRNALKMLPSMDAPGRDWNQY